MISYQQLPWIVTDGLKRELPEGMVDLKSTKLTLGARELIRLSQKNSQGPKSQFY